MCASGDRGACSTAPEEVEVAVVGAGFAGIITTVKLRKAGITSMACFEKEPEPGGVWWYNRYPGCACDIPSHLYSISFEDGMDWTRKFPKQEEVRAYIKDVVKRTGLAIRFNTQVEDACWDEESQRYVLTTRRTDPEGCEESSSRGRVLARFLIMCINPTSAPRTPDIPGLQSFTGQVVHTARWDPNIDLKGKRVAVIGTGSSAVQVVPNLAPLVDRLVVFQRTAPWISPKNDYEYSESCRKAFLRFPSLRRLYRSRLMREAEQWFGSSVQDSWTHKRAVKMCEAHRRRQVKDPALRAKLTPDYQLGCKRVIKSDDWYPTLQRDNVTLVTEGINEVSKSAILDNRMRIHAVDVIVLATGFDKSQAPAVNVKGRGIHRFREHLFLQKLPTYLGVSYAGFPNLFTTMGPHTGLGHNSVLFMMEAQADYIVDILTQMKAEGATVADLKPDVQESFKSEMQERLSGTVLLSGCSSWYLTPNPYGGRPRPDVMWPGTVTEYQARARDAKLSRYNLLRGASRPSTAAAEQEP